MKFNKPPTPLVLGPAFSEDADPAHESAADATHDAVAETEAVIEAPVESAPAERAVTASTTARPTSAAPARLAYPLAMGLSVAWAISAVMFAIGYQSKDWAFEFRPNQVLLLALVVVLPAIMLAIAAYSIRQGAQITQEARRARKATDEMIAPVVLAAGETSNVLEIVRAEIDRAVEVTAAAREQLAELRAALADESDRMNETVATAERAARLLTENLGNERLEMGILSAELDTRAASIAGSIQRQAKMVSEASDLAQTQIREAEAALAARAADLAAAAADAGEIGALASQQIGLNADRLENVAETVGERLGALWTGLARERESFEGMSDALRNDQTEVVARLSAQRSQLIDAVAQARVGTQEIHAAANSSSESLRRLIADAAAQVGALAETARAEHEMMDAQARSRLKLFGDMVAEERGVIEADTRSAIDSLAEAAEIARRAAANSAASFREVTLSGTQEAIFELNNAAEQARETARLALLDTNAAATAHTDAARARLDHLGELAFQAGQKADEIFDSRFAAARRLIEESSRLVEEAGQRSAQKIETSLVATRVTVKELEDLIHELAQHAGRLPSEAHANVEAVRAAVARGVGDLTSAARRAAEETQIIDAAFQERVRQNYEMLSESVRMMTKVAGAAETAARAQPEPMALAPVEAVAAPAEVADAVDQVRAQTQALHAAAETAVEQRRVANGASVGGPASGDRSIRFNGANRTRPEAPAASRHDDEDDDAPLELNMNAARAGLRPRLRLTPTEQDQEVKTVFEPVRPDRRPRETAEDWTWRDLLKNMDGGGRGSDEALSTRLRSEIEALGVDSAALLPRGRVDEIGRSLGAGDLEAGRDTVRRLAPAAVRRLARKMETDTALRLDAQRFVGRFGNLVVDALARDQAAATGLLGSEQGRIFLLLDAAVSPSA